MYFSHSASFNAANNPGEMQMLVSIYKVRAKIKGRVVTYGQHGEGRNYLVSVKVVVVV